MLSKSLVKARKTIRAKILELRKGKEELLKREYENFQRYLHGKNLLHSTQLHANKLKGSLED
jgi:hypothetical protein